MSITDTQAWRDGIERARHDLRGFYAAAASTGPSAVSYTSAVCSILASPHLLTYPESVREWLWSKATRWPRGMEQPHHAITRTELGLP